MSDSSTRPAFRDVLLASGLLPETRLAELDRTFPDPGTSPEKIAEYLVQSGDLTAWQAEKLLQGRHRGFRLGNFRLLEKLARGGMSTIYLARQIDSSRLCVLKVLPLKRAGQASYLPRFEREARLTAGLTHHNVVQVYGLHCESDGQCDIHFISMEYLQGENLAELVRRCGPLSMRQAADCIRQAADGLAWAHDAGLVHRDVKPANFLLTTDGVIKVLDLGLASARDPNEDDLTRQYDERVLGTADYLSPEQAVDSHLVDSRSDIYGLGCTLYFLLTGHPPFPGGTLAERILAHQTKQPVPVEDIRSDTPDAISRLVSRMLIKNRDDRIQSAHEVSSLLTEWLASIAGDPQFDMAPAASAPNDSDGGSAAADTEPVGRLTDTPPLTCASSLHRDEPNESAISGIYTPELEAFLQRLDEENGVNTVMNPDSRRQDLRSMSTLRDSRPESHPQS